MKDSCTIGHTNIKQGFLLFKDAHGLSFESLVFPANISSWMILQELNLLLTVDVSDSSAKRIKCALSKATPCQSGQ